MQVWLTGHRLHDFWHIYYTNFMPFDTTASIGGNGELKGNNFRSTESAKDGCNITSTVY